MRVRKWRGSEGEREKGQRWEMRMEHWVCKVGSSQGLTPCSMSLWSVWKLMKIVPPQCLYGKNNPSGFLSCSLVKLTCGLAKLGKCTFQRHLQMVGVQLGFQAVCPLTWARTSPLPWQGGNLMSWFLFRAESIVPSQLVGCCLKVSSSMSIYLRHNFTVE